MTKTCLITGTSSGLGRAAAELFAEHGWNVVATMRKPECDAGVELSKISNVHLVKLDVTNESDIKSAVQETLDKYGAIDALINNAGYGLAGPMEFATSEQLERQYSTNVFGPIRLMQAVLPSMRAAKSGVIVNVTSVGGRLVLPMTSLYHGTKYALEGVSESAAIELKPFGIKVRTVQPGGIKTDFSGRSLVMTTSEEVRDYDPMVANVVGSFMRLAATGSGSEAMTIAKVVYEATTYEGDKMRFTAGDDAAQMFAERAKVSDEEHRTQMMEKYNVSLDA